MSQGLLKWHRELDTFSQIKRAVILEGNINDTFAFPGSGRDRIQYYLGYFFADDYEFLKNEAHGHINTLISFMGVKSREYFFKKRSNNFRNKIKIKLW